VAAIERLAVIGVGLIGGSFALALKNAGAVKTVIGVGRDERNLEQALARGVVNDYQHDVTKAVRAADLVFVATPVGAMRDVFARIAPVLAPGALITDGGSTKRSVIEAARAGLGERIGSFVPAHPIAGSGKSGAEAASNALYRDREVILTPLPENQPADVAHIADLWRACGARVLEMAPDAHDEILATVSHVPHFVAYAYMHAIAKRQDPAAVLAHAGGGFRDFTRLASSHPRMWSDICMANRAALLAELDRYAEAAAELRALIHAGDAAALEERFTNARVLRDAWAASITRSTDGE